MTTKLQCLTCDATYKNEDDPRLRRFYADGTDEEVTDGSREPREGWGSRPIELRCENGHLLPDEAWSRTAIVMALYGETRSGKDAFKNAVVYSLENDYLFYRGFHAELRESQQEEHRAVEPAALNAPSTAPVTATEPRKPVFFTLTERQTGTALNFTLYNSSGEDNNPARRLGKASPYLSKTDVIVVMVPPPALPSLPESVRSCGANDGDDQQTPAVTKTIFRNLAKVISKEMNVTRRRQLVVVVALTKCDRYSNVDGFDRSWLQERPYSDRILEPLDIAMYNEQKGLHDFVTRYGGGILLEHAAEIGGKIFMVALSGTGSDNGSLRAPKQLSAPNRSLDPLLIALMRRKLGRLTLADLSTS